MTRKMTEMFWENFKNAETGKKAKILKILDLRLFYFSFFPWFKKIIESLNEHFLMAFVISADLKYESKMDISKQKNLKILFAIFQTFIYYVKCMYICCWDV